MKRPVTGPSETATKRQPQTGEAEGRRGKVWRSLPGRGGFRAQDQQQRRFRVKHRLDGGGWKMVGRRRFRTSTTRLLLNNRICCHRLAQTDRKCGGHGWKELKLWVLT